MITLTGKNSFLARALADHPETGHWRFLSHQDALSNLDWLNEADVLINCAFHPDLKTSAYDPDKDIDRILAGHMKTKAPNIHYIMLSSRLVYGEHPNPENPVFTEDMACNPHGFYACAKWKTEQALTALVPPEKLTVLRCANIFGTEPGRSTFFGRMFRGLQDNNIITFDIAPQSVRDFLYVESFATYLIQITKNPQAGLFHLGSGLGLKAQELAEIVIKAHGRGELVYTDQSQKSQFILDMSRTRATFGLNAYTPEDLSRDIHHIFSNLS